MSVLSIRYTSEPVQDTAAYLGVLNTVLSIYSKEATNYVGSSSFRIVALSGYTEDLFKAYYLDGAQTRWARSRSCRAACLAECSIGDAVLSRRWFDILSMASW